MNIGIKSEALSIHAMGLMLMDRPADGVGAIQ